MRKSSRKASDTATNLSALCQTLLILRGCIGPYWNNGYVRAAASGGYNSKIFALALSQTITVYPQLKACCA